MPRGQTSVTTFNFLGLHLTSNLSWATQEISNKISRVIGVIYKMQSLFPKRILLSLYNTMILPHINYCILSWGRDGKDILLLQKKAVRAIYFTDYVHILSHFLNVLTSLMWMLYIILKS